MTTPDCFSAADENWTVEVRADAGSRTLTFAAVRRTRRIGLGDDPVPWRGLALLLRDLLDHAAHASAPAATPAVAEARAILEWRPPA